MLSLIRVLPFLVFLVAMFINTEAVISSAAAGLQLWVFYVVPALFPFFIISDLVMKQGFIHFLGVLLEPLMRPIFRLPGKASFVIAMTHAAGIPIGAILTCQMRKTGELSQIEGQRLLAFTSNPSPGFIFGAVASGMLGKPFLGIIIAASVYLANLLVGLIFRFYGSDSSPSSAYSFSFQQALREMEIARQNYKKPFGEMIADAIRDSVSTILLVGGFIVFFSVATRMLDILLISTKLAEVVTIITANKLSLANGKALIQGLMETTLGCQAATTAFSSLNAQVGMLAFLLGWGGLSAFAQVASFSSTTDLRFLPFVMARVLHAFFALFLSQILMRYAVVPTSLPAMLSDQSNLWLYVLRWGLLYSGGTLLLLTISSLFLAFSRRYIKTKN